MAARAGGGGGMAAREEEEEGTRNQLQPTGARERLIQSGEGGGVAAGMERDTYIYHTDGGNMHGRSLVPVLQPPPSWVADADEGGQ